MKKQNLLLFILLLFVSMSFWQESISGKIDFWWNKWALLMAGIGVISSCFISRRYGRFAALVWLFYLGMGLYTFAWFDNQYAGSSPRYRVLLNQYSSYQTTVLLMFTVFAVTVTRGFLFSLKRIFAVLGLLDAAYVICQALFLDNYLSHSAGFFGNHSMNACFIALAWPLIIDETRVLRHSHRIFSVLFSTGLVIASVVLSKATIPVFLVGVEAVILCFVLAKYALESKKDILGKGLLAVCLVAFLVSVFKMSISYTGPDFFADGSRFFAYQKFMESWLENANIWIGTGPGTFAGIGPIIQEAAGFGTKDQWWIFAHSDWVQSCFEMGIIGAGLFLSFFVYVFIKQKHTALRASITGFGACMAVYHPWHHSVIAFMGLWLVMITLWRGDAKA